MIRAYLNTKMELKSISTPESTPQGEFAYFEGYAATFGNKDNVDDVVMAGAFKSSLNKNPKIKMLWQHDVTAPIGSYLEIYEDSYGLYVKGRINLGTEKGRNAYALLKAGDLDSMSIGYVTRKSDYDQASDVRYLKEVDLYEISLVSIPANNNALVTSVKSIIEEAESLSDLEIVLKSKGFSNKEAKTLISKFKQISETKEQPESLDDSKERDVPEEDDAPRDVDANDVLKSFADEVKRMSLVYKITH